MGLTCVGPVLRPGVMIQAILSAWPLVRTLRRIGAASPAKAIEAKKYGQGLDQVPGHCYT